MFELDEVKLVEMRWRAAPAQLEFFVSGQTRKPLDLNHLADQLITALADHTSASYLEGATTVQLRFDL
jgi:hypothetical protein